MAFEMINIKSDTSDATTTTTTRNSNQTETMCKYMWCIYPNYMHCERIATHFPKESDQKRGQKIYPKTNMYVYCIYTRNLSTISKLSRIIVLIWLRHIKPFDDVACFGPQLSTPNNLEKNDQFRLNLIIKLHRKCFYSYLHYFIYDYPVSTLPFCFFFFFFFRVLCPVTYH